MVFTLCSFSTFELLAIFIHVAVAAQHRCQLAANHSPVYCSTINLIVYQMNFCLFLRGGEGGEGYSFSFASVSCMCFG